MIADKDISLTFMKGMEVLEAFEHAAHPLTIPELSRVTGINRSVTRRLVLTLVQLGYLLEANRAYTPSPRVLRLASGYLKERQFGRTVQPVMASYSKRLGDAISLAVFTPATKTDPAAILKDLAEIRVRGFAHVTGEYEPGVASIAVAVTGANNIAKAALGIVGPAARFEKPEICAEKAELLAECADTLSSFV